MGRDRMSTFIVGGAIVVGVLVLAGVPFAAVALPLLLLACPLMMIFMNHGSGGEGGHGGHTGHQGNDARGEHTYGSVSNEKQAGR